MIRDYLDFELQIEEGVTGQYFVSVVASPAGETERPLPIPFPFTAEEIEGLYQEVESALLRSRLRTRKTLTPEEQIIHRFGQQLFEVVFQGDVRSLFYESKNKAQDLHKGLRLKLRLRPPEFAQLPWEFLWEPRRRDYICLSQDTPLVRYLEQPQPVRPLTVTPPLRILGMVASPYNMQELDVAAEKGRIEQALAVAQQRGADISIQWLAGETASDLQRALRRAEHAPYHIFHFIGHGEFDPGLGEGVLWLADERGRGRALTATQLARLLGDHTELRLVVLNACEGARSSELDVFSSTAATLVQQHIPAVLAMQYEISDQAALLLVEWFYESLAEGLPVDAAVAEARKAIASASAHTLEWGTPVLFMRAKDGRIFDVQPAPVGQPAPTPSEPTVPDKTPTAAGRSPAEKPAPRQPAPQQRPTLAVPPSGITIPHIVKGAAPLKIDWCWVPGGKFPMGSNDYDDEKPIHEVRVDGFWLARYPVTNAQYKLFIEAGGYDKQQWWTADGWQVRQKEKWAEPRYWGDAKWNGGQQPVVGVSWYEAVAFCAWAAETTGEKVRLPTEAEWEKGARGIDGRTFPWGETEPDEKLCHFNQDRGKGSTKPVGQFSPQGDSPYGCADMAGNVWDWTADWYKAYPGNSQPNDYYGEKYRVVRGGSWDYIRINLRCANRNGYTPDYRNDHVGFRCASTAF